MSLKRVLALQVQRPALLAEAALDAEHHEAVPDQEQARPAGHVPALEEVGHRLRHQAGLDDQLEADAERVAADLDHDRREPQLGPGRRLVLADEAAAPEAAADERAA